MRRLGFVALVGLVAALVLPAGSAVAATATVTPGHSIQAAINAAASGGTVVVARGTYRENLLITKTVRLVGYGAVLRPPAKAAANMCGQSESGESVVTGICVVGAVNKTGAVTAQIHNVWITGFTVLGFSGDGLFAFGSNGIHLVNDTFGNNGGYGAFVNTSTNTTELDNLAYGNGDAGFYIGDSPTANATLVGNTSRGNIGEGILWRDSLGGRISLNDLHDNCIGVLAVDTGAPGADGNVSITLNDISGNNRLCPADTDHPPFGGVGVGLLGSHGVTVAVNLIRGNRLQDGSAFPGGGVFIADSTMLGGTAPTGNSVHNNILSGNMPADLTSDGSGSGNTMTGNVCTTSVPAGSC
jgi:hypothetical protein